MNFGITFVSLITRVMRLVQIERVIGNLSLCFVLNVDFVVSRSVARIVGESLSVDVILIFFFLPCIKSGHERGVRCIQEFLCFFNSPQTFSVLNLHGYYQVQSCFFIWTFLQRQCKLVLSLLQSFQLEIRLSSAFLLVIHENVRPERDHVVDVGGVVIAGQSYFLSQFAYWIS